MKLSVTQKALSDGLSIVNQAVAKRSTLPVLSHVLLETDAERLKLTGTDLELGITAWVEAKIEEEGAITVPADLFSALIKVLPDERVGLTLEDTTLHVQCGRHDSHIKGIEADQFPIVVIPELDWTPVNGLTDMIGKVAFAAAGDNSRPVLTGVLIEDGSLVAADGYRLAVCEGEPIVDDKLLIPAQTMQRVAQIGVGEMARGNNQVFFRAEDVMMASQVIEGAFPNWRQILPKEHATRIIVDTGSLEDAVRTAWLFSRNTENKASIVRITVQDGELVIRGSSDTYGDSVAQIPAKVEGEWMDIACNARYLLDVLETMPQETTIELQSKNQPLLLRADGVTQIIMPMHIQE